MAYKKTGPGTAGRGKLPNSFKVANFDIEGTILKPEHGTFLRQHVLPKLKDGAVVKLFGMTDRTGSDGYNDQLSDKRIESVRAFLKQNAPGLFEVQISTLRGERAAELKGDADNTSNADMRGVFLLIDEHPPKPQPAVRRPRMDFIIRFIGNNVEGSLQSEAIFSDKSVRSATRYQQALDEGRRILNRFGHLTSDANRKGKRDEIRSVVLGAKRFDTLGLVILIGSSSGANNMLTMMQELAGDGIDAHLVAVADPAFFPNQARPATLSGGGGLATPLPIPSFGIGPVSPGKRLNFFQVRGNSSEFSFRLRKSIYSSTMLNKEIHGKIDGFEDFDLTRLCLRIDADELHVEVINLAVPPIRQAVIEILERAEELAPSAPRQ